MPDAIVSVRLSEELRDTLKDRAAFEGRSMNQIVVKALTQAATRWNQPTGKKASK
jgi:predicted HicB family RNase H-like nuclease